MVTADAKSSKIVDEMLSHLKADFLDFESSSLVAGFYSNRSIFITGATGFIGKALAEKLIRSCRDIKRVYLLIREKRGKDVNQRLAELMQSQIFNRIKSLPNGQELLKDKLRAIAGDITLPVFGISEEDMSELASEVSIVFNSAATVRFAEPVDVAVKNNIYSVSQLIEFCDRLKNLKALVHLSTAYSNCHKKDTIYEIFYEPPMTGEQIFSAVNALKQVQNNIHVYPTKASSPIDSLATVDEQNNISLGSGNGTSDHLDDECGLSRDMCEPQIFFKRQDKNVPNGQNLVSDLLEEFVQIALKKSNRPNTYTFTKAIAESYLLDLVKQRSDRYLNDKIPVAIVRPSITVAAYREPEVGYVDNYNGPTAALLGLYTGALQAMPGKPEKVADMVPVDMLVNMLASLGWCLGSKFAENGIEKASSSDSSKVSRNEHHNSGIKIKKDHGIYVFNFVSGCRNPLHWKLWVESVAELAYKYPSKFLKRLPSPKFVQPGDYFNFYDNINHKLPALVLDFIRRTIFRQELNHKTSALNNYGRLRIMSDSVIPFSSNQWRFSDSNVLALYDSLIPVDQKLFEFDVGKINWNCYIRNYIIGSRIYTLKDGADNVPAALKALKK